MQPHHLLAPALLVTLSASAQALMIDSFGDPYSASNSVVRWFPTQNDNIATATAPAAVPGGTRTMALPLFGGTGYQIATTNWSNNGRLEVLGDGLPGVYLNLSYGLNSPMNLDLSGQAALQLDFLWIQANALKLTVYATTAGTPGGNPDGSAGSWDLPNGSGPVLLPLSDFSLNSATGLPVNWGDVDSLVFAFSSPFIANGNLQSFGLESISATPVPEPVPAMLMALGLAAVALTRRRRTT
jgi:MYXO-CTERM domain-containing protein